MPATPLKLPTPQQFAGRMTEYWQTQLKLAPSPALLRAWQIMAETFNHHIRKQPDEWSVLPIPTGAGKTQGLIVYCAMLAEQPLLNRPGILIVTRFRDEADDLRDKINKLARKKIAIACHGKSDDDIKLARKATVLIVTHSAYMLAMDEVDKQEDNSRRWNEMIAWHHTGKRELTVIDEAINTVDTFSLDLDQLRLWRGIIPHHMAESSKYREVIKSLDEFITCYTALIQKQKGHGCYIPDGSSWPSLQSDMLDKLAAELGRIDIALRLYGKSLKDKAKPLQADMIAATFNALKQIVGTWSMYAQQGNWHQLSSGVAPLPPQLKSAVILDATASCNHAYKILNQAVNVIGNIPSNIRSYRNVKLHIHYGHVVGKGALNQKSPQYFIDLLKRIRPHLSSDKSFLLVLHKSVEEKVRNQILEAYPNCQFTHWGDIDGKNDWQELDTIILCGLHYLGELIPKVCVMAYANWYAKADNIYEPDILQDGITGEEYDDPDIEKKYEKGHLATSLIQAINRVRCRRVVDNKGNCDPTTIHLYLNKDDDRGQFLLEQVRKLMPDIKVIADNSAMKESVGKVIGAGLKVINYLRNKPPG